MTEDKNSRCDVCRDSFPEHELTGTKIGIWFVVCCEPCRKENEKLAIPLASLRGIPHPRGLGFLLRSQSQRSDSTGLKSRLPDGTILQIQKPVTSNIIANEKKNVKRNKRVIEIIDPEQSASEAMPETDHPQDCQGILF